MRCAALETFLKTPKTRSGGYPPVIPGGSQFPVLGLQVQLGAGCTVEHAIAMGSQLPLTHIQLGPG